MRDMTDREALEELLRRFGLQPFTGQDKNAWSDVEPPTEDEVILLANVGGVEGYYDFLARFKFDADGKFESLGIWE